MRANRKTNTRPELALRSALHRRGLRYRVHLPVTTNRVRVVPDVVFPARKVAVFADGCLWHCCPRHGTRPRSNAAYWVSKLAGNVERDRRVDAALAADGWTVVRIWEHELTEPELAAERVAREISRSYVAGEPPSPKSQG
jgi:DNA mismatch endonuclease (patch repair protein)